MIIGDGFVALAWIAVWVYGFVDALFADSDRVRLMPKTVWIILILIFGVFAAIPWFIWGRPKAGARPANRDRARGGGSTGIGWPRGRSTASGSAAGDGGWQLGGAPPGRRSGPVAPDDDPEFLRGLGRKRPRDDDKPGDDPGPAR